MPHLRLIRPGKSQKQFYHLWLFCLDGLLPLHENLLHLVDLERPAHASAGIQLICTGGVMLIHIQNDMENATPRVFHSVALLS